MVRKVLPRPAYTGTTPLEEAMARRRSVRDFEPKAVTLGEVSQLLWAAGGISQPAEGLRTVPSAGALYPLRLYLLAGSVEGLSTGAYRYSPHDHSVTKQDDRDLRAELSRAALDQDCIRRAPLIIVIAAHDKTTTVKYGERGIRYVHMEAGHASQNIYLQAVSLRLGTVAVGAFQDDDVKRVMGMEEGERPLYLIPVGRPARSAGN